MVSAEAFAKLRQKVQLSPFSEAYMEQSWYADPSALPDEAYEPIMERLDQDMEYLKSELKEVASTEKGSQDIYAALHKGTQELSRADEEAAAGSTATEVAKVESELDDL